MINKEELFNPEEAEIDYENMSKEELINLAKLQDSMLEAKGDVIDELNAVIDKMSELMTSPVHSKEWVKNYFRNEVKKEWKENLN